jgi:hypothetical protein
MLLLQVGTLFLLASPIFAASTIWCASTIKGGTDYCVAQTSTGMMDNTCTLDDVLGYKMKAYTVPNSGSSKCITIVRHINTTGLKERWVYRGVLDADMFPTCERFCELMRNLDFLFSPNRVYVSCSNPGLNNENLTDIVFSKGTPYNCSTNSNYAKPGDGMPPQAAPPNLPELQTQPPLIVKEIRQERPLPGWMVMSGVIQIVGLVLGVGILIWGLMLYIGARNDLSSTYSY